MNYDDMSTEELEKAYLEAKSQDESNLEKGDTEDGLLRQEEMWRNQEEISSADDSEGETPQDEIEYETSNTEEPSVTSNEEVTQESVNNQEYYRIKANGKEYDLTLDELKQTASKGMDYLKKTTALKPYRTMIAAMEQNKILPEDINLLIDLKNGNKEAISKIIKDKEIDIYDLPEADNYQPTEYRQSEKQLEINEIIQGISKEPEFSRTSEIYKSLDKQSQDIMNYNPAMLAGLHTDIKSGVFDKIIPLAEKKAMVDGYSKSFLEYYAMAGNELKANERPVQTPQTYNTTPQNRNNKIAAGLPTSRADKKNVIDYLDDEISDEDYFEWRKKLQRRV
jgi:hypothetical protein